MNLRLTRAAGKEAEGPRYLKKGRGASGVKATLLHRVIAKVEAISLFDLCLFLGFSYSFLNRGAFEVKQTGPSLISTFY